MAALSGTVLLAACADTSDTKVGGLGGPKAYQTVQITVEVPGLRGIPTAHMDDCISLSIPYCNTVPYGPQPASPQPEGVRNTIPAGALDLSPAIPLPTTAPATPYTAFFVANSPTQEGYYAGVRSVLAMSSMMFQRALNNEIHHPPAVQTITFSLNVPNSFSLSNFNFAFSTLPPSPCVAEGSLAAPDFCLVIHLPTLNEDATRDTNLYYEWRQASLYAAADAILAASESAFLACSPNCPTRTGGTSPTPLPDPVQN